MHNSMSAIVTIHCIYSSVCHFTCIQVILMRNNQQYHVALSPQTPPISAVNHHDNYTCYDCLFIMCTCFSVYMCT